MNARYDTARPRPREGWMGDRIAVQVKNDLAEIDRLSQIIEEFGAKHHLSTKVIFAVNLALEEIVVNIISYGYEDGGEHEIAVRVMLDANEVTVEVEDDARAFDPTKRGDVDTKKSVEERAIGGLGIHLVRGLFDVVDYRRTPRGNLLVIKKKITEA
jgi:anti-sigma regulatory factor (Ser/Thr protein kinase)